MMTTDHNGIQKSQRVIGGRSSSANRINVLDNGTRSHLSRSIQIKGSSNASNKTQASSQTAPPQDGNGSSPFRAGRSVVGSARRKIRSEGSSGSGDSCSRNGVPPRIKRIGDRVRGKPPKPQKSQLSQSTVKVNEKDCPPLQIEVAPKVIATLSTTSALSDNISSNINSNKQIKETINTMSIPTPDVDNDDPSALATIPIDTNGILVAVRIRPFLPFEISPSNPSPSSIINTLPNSQIQVTPLNGGDSHSVAQNTFTFDATFGLDSTQSQVYVRCVAPLVRACIQGYNATIIAYGQTGSGKTHSILGDISGISVNGNDGVAGDVNVDNDTSEAGVMPRALHALFQSLDIMSSSGSTGVTHTYSVKVQFLEVYGEDLRDLLQEQQGSKKLSIRDGRKNIEPEVIGASHVPVSNAEEALLCLTRGSLRRITRATNMNSESSRSHAIMSVVVEQKIAKGAAGESSVKKSKFHFVDLAGSERIKKTGASGQGVREGININKGLLVLGNVISALAGQTQQRGKSGGESFVPYRDSKLTRLLKGSLGGNHKTLMIACASPSPSNKDESLNTLRYANRAKNIQNKAVVNQDAGSKFLAEIREIVKGLAKELLALRDRVIDAGFNVENDRNGIGRKKGDLVFADKVLRTLASGKDVKIKSIRATASTHVSPPQSKVDASTAETVETTTATAYDPGSIDEALTIPVPTITPSTTVATTSKEDSERLKKAEEEIERLHTALKLSDARAIEYDRELEWMKQELRVSKEEVDALTRDGDESVNDEMSVITDDFSDGLITTSSNRGGLSQETYETVKDIYEEKLYQMSIELKEREEERENIAMEVYRHESDTQRLQYVKDSLVNDLRKKDDQISSTKEQLKNVSNYTIVPEAAPETERKFKSKRRFSRSFANAAAKSMTGYYTEKLNKISNHIQTREKDIAKLSRELEKLNNDSAMFNDLTNYLSRRLDEKETYMFELKNKVKNTKWKDGKPDELHWKHMENIEKEEDEKICLLNELERLKNDSLTFTALVDTLSQERSTKTRHIRKYKEKHMALAASIGLPSQYADDESGESDDVDDDASTYSNMSRMSIDTQKTVETISSSYSKGNITKKEYKKMKDQLQKEIDEYEMDRALISKDVDRLDLDTTAFTELATVMKEKLLLKEEHVAKLLEEQGQFANKLKSQQKELSILTTSTTNGKDNSACPTVIKIDDQ